MTPTIHQLPPSAFKYLAGLYEGMVDRGMNLAEMKEHLYQQGVRTSLPQIAYHLDNVFCFAGYSANHPAPAALTYDELDAIETGKTIKTRILVRASGRDSARP